MTRRTGWLPPWRGIAALGVAVAALCLAPAAWPGSAPAGRSKSAVCATCHGEDGISVQPNVPNLAGQPEIYVSEQLRAYRSGKRTHEVMSVIAKPLSDQDIDDLAAWFGSIRVEAHLPK